MAERLFHLLKSDLSACANAEEKREVYRYWWRATFETLAEYNFTPIRLAPARRKKPDGSHVERCKAEWRRRDVDEVVEVLLFLQPIMRRPSFRNLPL